VPHPAGAEQRRAAICARRAPVAHPSGPAGRQYRAAKDSDQHWQSLQRASSGDPLGARRGERAKSSGSASFSRTIRCTARRIVQIGMRERMTSCKCVLSPECSPVRRETGRRTDSRHDRLETRSDGRLRRELLKVWCSGRGCVGLTRNEHAR